MCSGRSRDERDEIEKNYRIYSDKEDLFLSASSLLILQASSVHGESNIIALYQAFYFISLFGVLFIFHVISAKKIHVRHRCANLVCINELETYFPTCFLYF